MATQGSNSVNNPTVVEGSAVVAPVPMTTTTQYPAMVNNRPQSTPPPPSPPPPPSNETTGRWALPPGWQLVHRPRDGRVYYWEVATGKTSWSHPMAPGVSAVLRPTITGIFGRNRNGPPPPPPPQDDFEYDRRAQLLDTPANARRRPDSHQCCAIASLLCCLPLGVLALYHSRNVDRHWKQGRYGDSVNSSKQAYNFAWFGCVLGGIIAIIWWARRSDWEMPDWNFDFGDR